MYALYTQQIFLHTIRLFSSSYRKANGDPFPSALEDCIKATTWFLRNAETYKVDPNRIAIVGEGAGGNLAAAVTQRLTFDNRYIDLPAVKFQGLFYPALQAFDFNLPSYLQNGNDPSLIYTKRMLATSWSLYLSGNDNLVELFITNNHTSPSAKTNSLPSRWLSSDRLQSEHKRNQKDYTTTTRTSKKHGNENVYNEIKGIILDPNFAPMLRSELAGLPTTYITIGEYDVVRDENILFADRLEEAGVTVVRRWYPLGLHGMLPYFMDPFILTDGKKCMRDFIDYAKNELSVE